MCPDGCILFKSYFQNKKKKLVHFSPSWNLDHKRSCKSCPFLLSLMKSTFILSPHRPSGQVSPNGFIITFFIHIEVKGLDGRLFIRLNSSYLSITLIVRLSRKTKTKKNLETVCLRLQKTQTN